MGLDYVKYADPKSDQVQTLEGRVIARFSNGIGMELTTGEWIFCRKENILERRSDDKVFAPLSQAEMVEVVKEKFPDFKILTSQNYIIAYQTSTAYADWYRQILESFYRSFTEFWKKRGASLTPPQYPLVVVLYTSKPAFQRHALDHLTGNIEWKDGLGGFYNSPTNHIFLYDSSRIHLSTSGEAGVKIVGATSEQTATPEQIAEFRKRPGVEGSINLLIHEGAHQLAYNTGLQPRLANCPSWVSEGIAIIRGAPKRKARSGWEINLQIDDRRYPDLRKYLRTNPQDPVLTLVRNSDDLIAKKETVTQIYAMGWGLTFYLMNKYPKEFIGYLNTLNDNAKPFSGRTEASRQKEFEQHFGSDWKQLEEDFAKEMMQLW